MPNDKPFIRIMTTRGLRAIELRDPELRSLIGEHTNAITRYYEGEGEEGLQRFKGMRVAGLELETDPEALDEWEAEGHFEFQDLYRETGL